VARYSYPPEKIKILLLENISESALAVFQDSGYTVELLKNSLESDELTKRLSEVHLIGIRSRTNLKDVDFKHAKNLLAIGCYTVGTNQVDLVGASERGVPVFNAPFGSTRSVAELAIGSVIMLARKAFQRSLELHRDRKWVKSAAGCSEVRGRTIGIIGYGHIGPQVGILAENIGMRVLFYDILPKLPFGNAKRTNSINELLEESDFVTLHVPETPQTIDMIGAAEIKAMKKGAALLNLARGSIVQVEAVREAILSNHLSGAAFDVFPTEPKDSVADFTSPLTGLDNVILTPHIGAATLEAQDNIAREVSGSLLRFLETGSTTGAVNFPQVELPVVSSMADHSHRILNVHKNVPGVLSQINDVFARLGVNITRQYLSTQNDIGYLIVDVDKEVSRAVKGEIDQIKETIRTRLLF
jgi:D-3-phosphoglycerate dehydrogenase